MAEEKESGRSESKIISELKQNPWIAGTFVFAIISLVLLFVAFRGGITGSVIGEDDIGSKAVDFVNTQLLQGQGTVTLDSVAEKGGLYEVTVNYNGQKVPAYFSKDGEYYVGTVLAPLTGKAVSDTTDSADTTPVEVPKSDKPEVELFIMTHCPYGTQAEKGILPAITALGSKVDFKVRFVHYFMHGDKEEAETYRQLCIRETTPNIYTKYLSCFLEDGDSARCMTKNSIANVDSCVTNKAKDYYAADSELSNGYGVQGSPTLIINGVEADFYPRSPDSALKVICSAFNTAPGACSQALSTANPNPGFGVTVDIAGHPASDTSCASA